MKVRTATRLKTENAPSALVGLYVRHGRKTVGEIVEARPDEDKPGHVIVIAEIEEAYAARIFTEPKKFAIDGVRKGRKVR